MFFLQEMLQEAWHYRQTNFSTYQLSDISIELNTELMPWTGKFFNTWAGPIVSLAALVCTHTCALGLR